VAESTMAATENEKAERGVRYIFVSFMDPCFDYRLLERLLRAGSRRHIAPDLGARCKAYCQESRLARVSQLANNPPRWMNTGTLLHRE
jgi:hypothetical protein